MKILKYKVCHYLFTWIILFMSVSCNNFLDIIPDNVATVDHAFTSTVEAEKYLFTCYSYLPNLGHPNGNPGFCSGDEFWLHESNPYQSKTWSLIARNLQNTNNPAANYWDGFDEGKPLFQALRECNTFLENVEDLSKISDLTLDKRTRWIAEVKFLKAYYHFFLMRMYGPIPIRDKNIPISASPEVVRIMREPVDKCVDYIVGLLDESFSNLPLTVFSKDENGRITKPINRAIKARVLLLAASPLFNGNSDYTNFKNKNGTSLFNTTYDETKWKKAADAAKEAITTSESAGHELFYFKDSPFPLSDTSLIQMSIRHAVCERWNKEVVWGMSGSRAGEIQKGCMARLAIEFDPGACPSVFAPTLKIVRQFYTKNGVPIEEDKTLNFDDLNTIRVATYEERYNFAERYETARINFDRENRFYASVGFDGGKWLMFNTPSRSDDDTYVVKAKKKQMAAGVNYGCQSETGYFTKKLVNCESLFTTNSTSVKEYPWPEVRLADVYLMYAEALNEVEGPVEDVHKYMNLIRKRAGLEPVADSWRNFSTNPAKPASKEGMRQIIQRERLNELAFEGSRFWDLRRWKTAANVINAPVTGWDINQSQTEDYYQIITKFQQKFVAPRDYLWPLRNDELSVNFNLIQNPGW